MTTPDRPSLGESARKELERLEQARTGRGEAAVSVDRERVEASVSTHVGQHWTMTGYVRRYWDAAKGWNAGAQAKARWLVGAPEAATWRRLATIAARLAWAWVRRGR